MYDKSQVFFAKAAILHALTLFTQHWGKLFSVVSKYGAMKTKHELWTETYNNIDSVGHDVIDTYGDFEDGGPEGCLEQIGSLRADVTNYRDYWPSFKPNEDDAAAYAEAMALLDQVTAALDEATGFLRAGLPAAETES